MKVKQRQNIFHVVLNASSIAQHEIRIKNGMIKHVNVNAKIIVNRKKIKSVILALVFVRI